MCNLEGPTIGRTERGRRSGCSKGVFREGNSRVVGPAQDRVVVLAAVEDAQDGDPLGLVIDEGGNRHTLSAASGANETA